jgi:hypothetical protein
MPGRDGDPGLKASEHSHAKALPVIDFTDMAQGLLRGDKSDACQISRRAGAGLHSFDESLIHFNLFRKVWRVPLVSVDALKDRGCRASRDGASIFQTYRSPSAARRRFRCDLWQLSTVVGCHSVWWTSEKAVRSAFFGRRAFFKQSPRDDDDVTAFNFHAADKR